MERELLAILRVDDGIVRSCVPQPFCLGLARVLSHGYFAEHTCMHTANDRDARGIVPMLWWATRWAGPGVHAYLHMISHSKSMKTLLVKCVTKLPCNCGKAGMRLMSPCRYVLGLAHSHGLLGEAAPEPVASAADAAAAVAALRPFLQEHSEVFYHELRHSLRALAICVTAKL